MSGYGGKQLAQNFRTVRGNTVKIAEKNSEGKDGFQANADTRTIGQLLAHIALGHRFQQLMHKVERRNTVEGFDFRGFHQRLSAEEAALSTKAQILDALRREGDAWASWLEGLSDEFLAEPVASMPGTQ